MIGTLLLIGIPLSAVLGGIISIPLWSRPKRFQLHGSATLDELETHLHQLVGAVRDLDFDYDTGKISKEDYIEQRKLMVGRGVSAVLRLRQWKADNREADDEIEQLIASYRDKGVTFSRKR